MSDESVRGLLRRTGGVHAFFMKRELNLNLSGNEVYYTACSLPVFLKNSCGRLHCQEGFNLITLSYSIR